jgi:hypothetical protein
MRHLCVVVVLAAALFPATARADGSIVLKSIPIPPGTKYTSVHGSVMAMDMDSTAAGKSFRTHTEKREAMTYRAEVLAVNEVAETQLRVRFLQAEETNQKPGKDGPEKKVDPVAGKTYLVTAAGGPPTVTAADGRAVSDEERKKVQSAFSDLGHRDPVCAALVGRTLTPGEPISLDPSVVRAMMKVDAGDKVDVQDLTVTLREVRKRKSMPVAVFDVAIRIHSTEGGGGMTMALQAAGTVEYGLDNCWPVQEETKGPLAMSGSVVSKGQTIVMQGLGTALSILRMDYP